MSHFTPFKILSTHSCPDKEFNEALVQHEDGSQFKVRVKKPNDRAAQAEQPFAHVEAFPYGQGCTTVKQFDIFKADKDGNPILTWDSRLHWVTKFQNEPATIDGRVTPEEAEKRAAALLEAARLARELDSR